MPLNIQTFKTRAVTALLFVAVMLTGLLWSSWGFILLFTVIHFGCWYEWIKLIRQIKPGNFLPYASWGLIYITMPVLMITALSISFQPLPASVPGQLPLNRVIPCGIIFSIWVNDTMAYLVGSFIGKTPLTSISPKKTWEGTLGGIVLCVLTMGFVYPLLLDALKQADYKQSDWFIIPAICAVFGTLGDLFESKLKRLAGVKDSGHFLPGHGGFLDRFDSLLVAIPVVWLYITLVN